MNVSLDVASESASSPNFFFYDTFDPYLRKKKSGFI